MKCPICHGTGIEKIYDKRTNAYLHIPCATCHETGHINETGSINQTNEEWFCRLSTEEKADLLAELVWWIHPSVQGGRKVELTKESFLRWLKEKHND